MFASAHDVLSDKGVDMPVVMLDSFGPDSSWPGCGCACRCATTGAWSDTADSRASAAVAVIAGRRHPGHGAEADSHGSPCSEDHRDSPAQYFSWLSMSLFAGRADSSLLSV